MINLKKTIILAAIAVLALGGNSYASKIVNLQGKDYQVDTLKYVKVGPGTYYSYMLYSADTKKFRAHTLEMEMKGHDDVEFKMEIGQDSTLTAELISSIAKRKTTANKHYYAGVNADFYIVASNNAEYAGFPHMDCVMDGEVASTSWYEQAHNYGHFFMDYDKYMWCDNPKQSYTVTFPNGDLYNLSNINFGVYNNCLTLFNSKYGCQTRIAGTTDVRVKLAEGQTWGVNKDIILEVVDAASTSGHTKIKKDGAVLSGLGTAAAELATLKVGDKITYKVNMSLADYQVSPNIKEVSGGDVVLLKRGKVIYEAYRFINARDSNNPRTMFGYNEDRSKMMWCTIDGRQGGFSAGCTYQEGAEVMLSMGCYDAVNVDGGGSAEMYIAPFGIVNSPSDGKERPVANGLYAVLNAPEDNNIAELRFVDYSVNVPKYGYYKPKFYGYNKYGLLIDTNVQGAELSCGTELGEVIENGTSLMASGLGIHLLTASFNGVKATIPVNVVDSSFDLKYKTALVDGYNAYAPDVVSVIDGAEYKIANRALEWWSDDDAVATVNEKGEIMGLKNGSTTVHGKLGSSEIALAVTVEKPEARYMPVEANPDPATWKFTQIGGTLNEKASLPAGFNLKYTGKGGRSPYLKLSKAVQLYSLPDSIRIRINPGEASVNAVTFQIKTALDKSVTHKFAADIKCGIENSLTFPISDIIDVKERGNYPLTLNYINFGMGKSESGKEYEINIPGIEVVYTAVPNTGSVETVIGESAVIPVYPNPVTAGEPVNIDLSENAAVVVYDSLGRFVAGYEFEAGKNVINTSDLASGTYIIKIEGDNNLKSSALIIK